MSNAFKKQYAIYEQIANTLCERILNGSLKEEEKISSIRETAITMEVNPNTVQRAYEWLQNKEIIYTKRGRGYFVSEGAVTKVMQSQRQRFFEETLPEVFKSMELLGITPEEISHQHQLYLKQDNNENV